MKGLILRLAVSAPLVLVLAIAGVVVYFDSTTPRTDMTLTEFETASKALSQMDYDTAVVVSNDGIKNAETNVQRIRYKLILAETLWDRNQGSDRTQALALYKEVALSEDANAIHRAIAFNDLAIIVNTTDFTYLQDNFADQEFRAFIPSEGTHRQIRHGTFFNLLTRSIEIYPTSFAHYAIAGHYYVLRLGHGDLRDSTREELAARAFEHVQKGDAIKDQAFFSAYPNIKGFYYRALALSTVGKIIGEPTVAEREAAYKLVLDTAAEFNISPEYPVYGTVLSTRFFYARFLLEFASNRTEDIIALLRPFSQVDPQGDRLGVFTNFDGNPPSMKTTVPLLAEISPDFKAFATRLGILVQ